VTLALTLALSPRERVMGMVAVGSSDVCVANPVADNFAERGNDFSLSLGERASNEPVNHCCLVKRIDSDYLSDEK
jgi:hypothetical protein